MRTSLMMLMLAGCTHDVMTEVVIEDDAASDASSDAWRIPDVLKDGEYRQGNYLCCAPGEGQSCCPSTPPGQEALCLPYGGASGRCSGAGGDIDGKDICSVCCAGLVRSDPVTLAAQCPDCNATADPACVEAPIPGTFWCLPCGNGVCEPKARENFCNCPADCPRPIDAGTQ